MSNKQPESMSKSKEKRLNRKKELAKEKRNSMISRIISILIVVLLIAGIGSAIGWNVYKAVATTESSKEFSKCLTDDGLIQNVNVNDSVTVADYKNTVVPLSEVKATDEEVQNDIDSALNANKVLSTDHTKAIIDGDTVNIDYVGTVDGKEFEGGSSEGNGHDLTIGSDSFVDGFEDQLIGHKPGEELTVNVTFPEDYQSAEVAGKDASFAVTVNGIYVLPEFNDDFVAEHFSDYAKTADEYRTYLQNNYYKQHLSSYLETYLSDNSTVTSYPKAYVKNLKQTLKYQDESTMDYYNQMYKQYTGSAMYNTVYDMANQNWFQYEKALTEKAQKAAKDAMVYQSIYEKEALQFNTDEYLKQLDTDNGEGYTENVSAEMGQGYLVQQHIKEVVLDYLIDTVTVQ